MVSQGRCVNGEIIKQNQWQRAFDEDILQNRAKKYGKSNQHATEMEPSGCQDEARNIQNPPLSRRDRKSDENGRSSGAIWEAYSTRHLSKYHPKADQKIRGKKILICMPKGHQKRSQNYQKTQPKKHAKNESHKHQEHCEKSCFSEV